jgi:hypothetical protein
VLTSLSFDQARLIRHNRILARNGIDPSGLFGVPHVSYARPHGFLGMPLDSKAVTRL